MSHYLQQSLKKYKVIVIGRSGVGKSALLMRYINGIFDHQKPTVLIDYLTKKVAHEDRTFNLQIWDSAGQARYRTIVTNYFSLSKAACVVFDLSDEDSFNDAKMWLDKLEMHCGNQIPKILLGNKRDLFSPQKLQEKILQYKERINELQQEYDCKFFEVSAMQGTGIDEAFAYLVKQIHQKNKQGHEGIKQSFKLEKSSLHLSFSNEQKKRKCC